MGSKMVNDFYILEPETIRWTRPTLNGKSPRARAGHTCTAIGPAPQSVAERKEAIAVQIKASEEANGKKVDDSERELSPRGTSSSQTGQTLQQSMVIANGSAPADDMSGSSTEANTVLATLPSQRLLIFGGGDDDGLMNDLHLLEVDTLSWSPVFTAGNTPSPRSRHTATLVKSTLWVIGGLGEGQTVFNDVYTLNTSSMVWSKPAVKGNQLPPRWGHSAIRSGSLILVFGGHSGTEVLNDLYILDTDSLTWRLVDTSSNPNGPPSPPLLPPTSPAHPSTSITALPNVLSNSSASGSSSNALETPLAATPILNPASTSSSTCSTPTSASTPVSFGANLTVPITGSPTGLAASNGTNILPPPPTSNGAAAALLPPSELTTVVESDLENGHYDPSKVLLHHGGLSVPPAPRCGHTANFVLLGRERKMVIFGGSNAHGESFNDTLVLDLDTFCWTHLSIKGSLPSARSIHSCNTIDDKLFVIGGVDSSRRFKDIYTLSLASLLSVEDPGMTPIRGGRPRRASRASPRVHTTNLASPSAGGGASIPLSPTVTTATPTHFNATHLASAHNNHSNGGQPLSPHATNGLTNITVKPSFGDEPKSSPRSGEDGDRSASLPASSSHHYHHHHHPSNAYYHPPHVLSASAAVEMSNWAEESEGRASSPAPSSVSSASHHNGHVGGSTSNPHAYPSPGRQRSHSHLRRSMPVSSSSPSGGVHNNGNGNGGNGSSSQAFLQTAVHRSQAHHGSLSSPSSPSPPTDYHSQSSPHSATQAGSFVTVSSPIISTASPAVSSPVAPSSTLSSTIASIHNAYPISSFSTPQKETFSSSQADGSVSAHASPIASFLTQLGLSRLVSKFEQEEIDMSVLPYLTDENLEFLGVNTLGARLRLGNAIQTLRSSPATSSMPGTPLSSQSAAQLAPQPPLTPTALSALHVHSPAASPTPSSLGSPYHSPHPTAPSTEALEASVERLVSTVLVATNTLTETMHFITNKLTQQQQPPSPAPTLLHPSQHALIAPSSPTLSAGRNGQRRSSLLEAPPSTQQ